MTPVRFDRYFPGKRHATGEIYLRLNRRAMRSGLIIAAASPRQHDGQRRAIGNIPAIGQTENGDRQRRPTRRINHYRCPQLPIDSDRLSASAEIIHGVISGNVT